MRVSILGIPPLQVCTYEIMFRIYYILTVIYLIHSQSATGLDTVITRIDDIPQVINAY